MGILAFMLMRDCIQARHQVLGRSVYIYTPSRQVFALKDLLLEYQGCSCDAIITILLSMTMSRETAVCIVDRRGWGWLSVTLALWD